MLRDTRAGDSLSLRRSGAQLVGSLASWRLLTDRRDLALDLHWRESEAADPKSSFATAVVRELIERRDARPDFPRPDAASGLFTALLDVEDAKGAEAMWPRVRARLTWREEPEKLGRIALAAARSGARADARRLWSARANLDPGDDRWLDEMARAGMRDDLVAFYERMAAADPASIYPGRMLARLAALK